MKQLSFMPCNTKQLTGVHTPRVRQAMPPLICKRLQAWKPCSDTRNIHFDQRSVSAWMIKSMVAIMLVLIPGLLSAKPAVKPSEPLSINMDYQATEEVLTYVMHIYLLSTLPENIRVRVNILSPDSARWLSGDTEWQGTLYPQELRTLTLTGRFSLADINDIVATISTDDRDDVQWSATTTVSLPNTARSLSVNVLPKSANDQRYGQSIITFSLDP